MYVSAGVQFLRRDSAFVIERGWDLNVAMVAMGSHTENAANGDQFLECAILAGWSAEAGIERILGMEIADECFEFDVT